MKVKVTYVDYCEFEDVLNEIGMDNVIQIFPNFQEFGTDFVIIYKEKL
ncbi:MAG: hypothetical protein IJZ62_04370 [Clostridia bacterium]|nr:hypothetical protein [Clostridia bacterium]